MTECLEHYRVSRFIKGSNSTYGKWQVMVTLSLALERVLALSILLVVMNIYICS